MLFNLFKSYMYMRFDWSEFIKYSLRLQSVFLINNPIVVFTDFVNLHYFLFLRQVKKHYYLRNFRQLTIWWNFWSFIYLPRFNSRSIFTRIYVQSLQTWFEIQLATKKFRGSYKGVYSLQKNQGWAFQSDGPSDGRNKVYRRPTERYLQCTFAESYAGSGQTIVSSRSY